jgi:hypothetical protein
MDGWPGQASSGVACMRTHVCVSERARGAPADGPPSWGAHSAMACGLPWQCAWCALSDLRQLATSRVQVGAAPVCSAHPTAHPRSRRWTAPPCAEAVHRLLPAQPAGVSQERDRSHLHVEHLSLRYPGRVGHAAAPILNDVSFSLERGRAALRVRVLEKGAKRGQTRGALPARDDAACVAMGVLRPDAHVCLQSAHRCASGRQTDGRGPHDRDAADLARRLPRRWVRGGVKRPAREGMKTCTRTRQSSLS